MKHWRLIFSKCTLFALSLMMMLCACGSQMIIVNELEEKDANEIIVFLASYDIGASKIAHAAGMGSGGVTWNVSVASADKMRALSLLNMNGLPRKRGQNLLSLFQKQGLVSSEMEEKIRYQAGLAEQIANTIRKIDGVLDADIQISFPQEDSLPNQVKEEEQAVTASVYVKHQGVLDNPNSHLIMKIKRLVSSSIQKLEFDNVMVISDRAIFSEPMMNLDNAPDITLVWGIRVVTESVSRLQNIFFTLISMFVLSLISLIWMGYKLHKILSTLGGIRSLFSLSAWSLDEEEENSEEDKGKDGKGKNDKGDAKNEDSPESIDAEGEDEVEGDSENFDDSPTI